MNNKGFTLVELIATIALLAIISIISFVSINAVIESSKINECNALVNSIKSATKEYVSDNRYNITDSGTKEYMNSLEIKKIGSQKYVEITANDLVSNNYLSATIANPFNNNEIIEPTNIKIKVYLKLDYTVGYTKLNPDDKTKDIIVKNNTNNEINCDNKKW